MKTDYNERKQARIERAERLAEKNKENSNQHYNTSAKIGSYIPFGQPILIGHHSEAKHRKAVKEINNNMRKSIQAEEKAAYYADKAHTIENNTAISSDDPEALNKLKQKLDRLTKKQELMKAANKVLKSKATSIIKVEAVQQLGVSEKSAITFIDTNEGFETWKISNNSAEIRRIKKRIEKLEAIAKLTTQEITINKVLLVQNIEDNRIQIFFPAKPNQETREKLKSFGFKWSPKVGAWMRFVSKIAVIQAKNIAHQYSE